MPQPNDTTQTDPTPTDAVDTAAVDTSSGPAEPVDTEAAAIAAFDKGVTEVAAPAPVEEKPVVPPIVGGEPLVVDHAAPPAAAAPAAPALGPDGKPVTAAPASAAPAAAADAETDTEVKDLGLKGKAETRFREMASTIKTQATELEPLRAAAARGQQWEEMVLATNAPPEQFNRTLQYLGAINSGNPQLMGQAFDVIVGELKWLGEQLGREIPGIVDPLIAHPDLAQDVENGTVSRARALELVQLRAASARTDETSQRTQAQADSQRVLDQAMADSAKLNDRLKAEDPDFDLKFPFLIGTLKVIRETVHPSKWVAAIEQAWKELPAVPRPAAAPRAPIRSMPTRATGTSVGMTATPKNDLEAFDMGMASVAR